MDVLLFFLLSFAGYLVFRFLKTPAPALLGAVFAVGAAGCLWGLRLDLPAYIKPGLSLILGCLIGMHLNIKLQNLWKEALLSTGWIVAIATLTAKILTFIGLRESTAVFASLPAGIAEVTLVALSFGGNPFEVALLQSTRIIVTCTLIPLLVKKIPREDTGASEAQKDGVPMKPFDWLVLAVLGLFTGVVFRNFGIPAPYLIGPMIGSALYTKLRNLFLPRTRELQTFAQMGVGGLIGLSVTREGILSVYRFLPSIVVLNICLVGAGLLFSIYLHRYRGWDWTTSLLATAPAGLTPLTALALEMKADVAKVAVLQVLRMVSVILFAPLAGYLSL